MNSIKCFKGILVLFVLFVALTSVNADFSADFRNPRAVCDETSLKLLTVHNGHVIMPEDIKIMAEDEHGNSFPVLGKWYINGQEVQFIKGVNPSAFTDAVFVADTLFPKNENYRLVFSYKKESGSEFTSLDVVANCPGRFCDSNIQCAETEQCKSGRCSALSCNVCEIPHLNTCISKCQDRDLCTKDSCNVDGLCSFTKIANCCIKDADCNDDLVCTTDSCVNSRCVRKAVECKGTDVCVDGFCSEGKGCQYETNLTCLNEENRRYVLQVGGPDVVRKSSLPTSVISWISTFFKNFFG